MRHRFLEFFAGAGLTRLGLDSDWECAWANDISEKKASIYRHNFGDQHLIVDDVANVSSLSLPSNADMAWASFPCQDLSLAGWRRGMTASRSGAFWMFWKVMRDLLESGLRPPIIVIENVAGLLYGENFRGLGEALAALNMQFGALVIDARWFLPHSRPRVFIIAVDSRVDCCQFLDDGFIARPWFPKAVQSAWESLPPTLQERWNWWKLPIPTDPIAALDNIIEDMPTGVQWRSTTETQRIIEMMTPVNRQKVEHAAGSGERRVGFLYRRTREGKQRAEVRFDGISGCLRTTNGGSSRQTVLIVEGGRMRSRLLSPREAARLMGVPDSFWLPISYNAAYAAMGDGVAVPVVSWLARHLLTPLADKCSESELAGERIRTDGVPDELMATLRQTTEAAALRWELAHG